MANEETLAEVIRNGIRKKGVTHEELAYWARIKLEDVEHLVEYGTHPDINKLYAVLLTLDIEVRLPSFYRPPNDR